MLALTTVLAQHWATARPKHEARIVAVEPQPGGPELHFPQVLVTLELTSGMGQKVTPAEGSVPEPGEELCYAVLAAGPALPAKFPSREQTPWTHGGPPKPFDPDEYGGAPGSTQDADEDWS